MAEHLHGQRPGSVGSVASKTSTSSGISLARRARTRARSKTLTSGPSQSDSLPKDPVSELPYLDGAYVQEPQHNSLQSPNESKSTPPHSPRSPSQSVSDVIQIGTSEEPNRGGHFTAGCGIETGQSSIAVKLTKQTSGLHIVPTASQLHPPPSAFSRDPSLMAINVRDSLSTQLSGVSSIYPPSTSTASGPDSPTSPPSVCDRGNKYDVSSYDPEIRETQEYDSDDVSYRLRLLVNNNYFLPPAHSKPSPADFASSNHNTPKKVARSITPTFLDLFRGKSKSKPTTPTGSTQPSDAPALRTAADSVTSPHGMWSQTRNSSQLPRSFPYHHSGTGTGRVAVVREKMHDLSVAAKKAEQDMKSRGVRRDQDSTGGQATFDPVIDPTDAVDLPLPSLGYPFAVQASAAHGLGVQDSVGAALLADRLPPPNSPGMSSHDTEDDWRRAILHQAVHHSFDSTSPDVSSFSTPGASSTPLGSLRLNSTEFVTRTPREPSMTTPLLERRIINNPRFSDASPPLLAREKSTLSQASTSRGQTNRNLAPLDTSRPLSFLPLRVDTPSGPLTPLTPPPRKYLVNPLYSQSQTELSRPRLCGQQVATVDTPSTSLRKTMSSPRLSGPHSPETRHLLMTPPPLPTPTTSTRSSLQDAIRSASFDEPERRDRISHATSVLQYSDDEVPYDSGPRASTALSVTDGRPSFSEYSQPSPTLSAFHTIMNNNGDHSSYRNSQHGRISVDQGIIRDSPIPRYSATSPPPRISSSLAHVALSPPPRASSSRYRTLKTQASTPTRVLEPPLTDDTTLVIIAPEPTSPSFPTPERRRNSPTHRVSLDAPPTNIPIAIHSTPGPSSPTSFFDSIQTQPNAMDDLDSSSDESEGHSVDFQQHRNRTTSNPSMVSRPPIMRLGNHSTPYVSQAVASSHPPMPFGSQDPKKPIGNSPIRAPFFTELSGKSDPIHGPPVSALDFYKYTQQRRPATATELSSKRRSTIGPVEAWRTNQRTQDSLKKLDGMLIQHMEAERDTIKRIAGRSNNKDPRTSHATT